VGVKSPYFVVFPFIFLSLSSSLFAAPKLRLVTAALGPVTVAQGSNGPAQTVEAYNAGDGSLALNLSSSANWLGTSTGAPRACSSQPGTCIPLQFALNTSGLSAGAQTAIVTVADPNAIDAPQTITVTVQIGSPIPNSVDVYAGPGLARDIRFSTNSNISYTVRTQDGANWLNLVLDGGGSFQFPVPYKIHVAPLSGMAEATYNGTLTVSGSTFAGDNHAVAVTMRVTTQPIAVATPERLQIRVAQGGPPVTGLITVDNAGQGSLNISNNINANASGVNLSAVSSLSSVFVTADPNTQAPGTYSGSVTISSNAVNSSLVVPVDVVVVPKGPPLITFQGVQDNATFIPGDAVTPGDVAVVKGEQLSYSQFTPGPAPPLSNQIGGAMVLVNGKPAPLYYSLYGQLAFQVPLDTPPGTATVQVQRDGVSSNTVSVDVAGRAPRLLPLGVASFGAIINATDGSLPLPSTYSIPGFATHPAKAGDVLTIYAIGLGQTDLAVATGAPAPYPPANLTVTPTVSFGGALGASAKPFFAGLSPTYAGLYQLNVVVPDNAPKGVTGILAVFPDSISNIVQIALQ
jgi:uncharacterized protein (TIGR03437 family)